MLKTDGKPLRIDEERKIILISALEEELDICGVNARKAIYEMLEELKDARK